MPRGLRQVALSISFLSPMSRRPDAFLATNIASLIFRPDLRFLALTSFQSLNRPNLSSGSSSRISLFKQSVSVSRPRLRPPGNIHSRSRLLLTNKTRPRFDATSFDDFAITAPCYLNTIRQHSIIRSLLQRKLTRNSARFTPSAIEVLHCREMIPHGIASDNRAFARSKVLDTDDSYSVTFTTAGTYKYFCYIHPHMTGTIIVDPTNG
jgi:Copper binding proteins, plastocyanin/azurin family